LGTCIQNFLLANRCGTVNERPRSQGLFLFGGLFLVRGLQKYCRRNSRIRVARILAMNREHGSLHIAILRWWSEHWRLHPGRVGRAVFDWAPLHGYEDDYERRIKSRDKQQDGVHDFKAKFRQHPERRDHIQNPDAAINETRLDEQSEDPIDP